MARGLPGPTGRPGSLLAGGPHPTPRPRATVVAERGARGCRPQRSQPVSNRVTPTSDQRTHTFVLDTSVLIADPAAFLRFAEHDVVLPLVVISELEGKRNHPELGYFA